MTPLLLAALLGAAPSAPAVLARLADVSPDLEALYRELHRAPELSLHEERTAARLAERLAALGFEVTPGVGGHGVVGVLRNGKGPAVLLRADMDALPVKEATGLPYASEATAVDASGAEVPVMHACGHDLHMSAWVGAAALLSGARDRWRGTLVMMAQPAEEVARGARAMLEDGLLTRFPRPDAALALHVTPSLPAGRVAVRPGSIMAMLTDVDVVVYGRGGHGAAPHRTVDPVLLASRIVVALQGIVAREVNPTDPAVITVGSIHGGTRANVIPDEVRLQLTVRSLGDDVQRRLLDAIARVARGEAQASGAPREPAVTIAPGGTRPMVNDPAVTARVHAALERTLGRAALGDLPPPMGSEDFAELGHAGIPSALVWVGTSRDAAAAEAARRGEAPGLHTARFAPELAPTLRTAVAVLTAAALELLAAR